MKGKVNVFKESYKHYRFKNERYKVSADYSEYTKIASAFFKNLFEKLVTTGFLIELPSRMGAFVIEQYDVEKCIDKLKDKGFTYRGRDRFAERRHFKLYGFHKKIYYDTTESDGKMWTFSWLKAKKGAFRNKNMFSFSLVRSNVRSTSNKDYSSKSKRLTVHDFFREEGYKLYREVYRVYSRESEKQNNNNQSNEITK